MKFNTPSSVALMKTFYNFVVRPNRQRHNISESVSLIPVPKSGKFQTCAGRATTLVTVLPYHLISHIRCGVLFIHPHIGFSRTSEQMNGQTPHFRVYNNRFKTPSALAVKFMLHKLKYISTIEGDNGYPSICCVGTMPSMDFIRFCEHLYLLSLDIKDYGSGTNSFFLCFLREYSIN